MATEAVNELRKKTDATWRKLSGQLRGMEPYLDTSDAPGEWTACEVLCHLLFAPGWNPVTELKSLRGPAWLRTERSA